MTGKHNPRNLHRIRTRQVPAHGFEREFLQAVLGLAYTVQQQIAKPTAKLAAPDSLAEGLHPALQRIAACAQNLTEASGAAIALGGSDAMVCVARSGHTAPPIGARFDANSGLSGECMRSGEYAICVNAAADPRVNYQACRALGISSLLYLPLCSAHGKIIGMLGVFAAKPLHFSQRDIASLRFTEGLVQEAVGRSADGPDPATLQVLLRQADIEIAESVQHRSESVVVPAPEPQFSPDPRSTNLQRPITALPFTAAPAALPNLGQTKTHPAPEAIFVGRIVDEDAAEEGDLPPAPDTAAQARSRIPAILAVMVAALIAFGAWKYNHMFRSAAAPPKPVAQPAATQATQPNSQPAASSKAGVAADAAPAERALTSAVSLRSEDAAATITIQLPKAIRFEGYQLTNPDRVYFDLHDVKLTDAKGSVFQNDDGLIARVRLSDYGKGITRVVFDLREPATFEARLAEKPERLIIELHRTGTSNRNALDSPTLPTKFTIVIDPGHGGRDLGTVSPNGMQEKDLVLDVALRLRALLRDRLGANVIMTRIDDSFISLDDRALIANSAHADFMISIHGNSSNLPSVRGVETYYFESPAMAMKEASAPQEDTEDARAFAADVHKALLKGLTEPRDPMRDRGVRQASFLVLREAQMPAVLAEISYLTSRKDEPRLESSAYREQIARALYRGIANHVKRVRARAPSVAVIGYQQLPGTP